VIASVAGRLVEADADGLVVEVGGVGLRIHASAAAARSAQESPAAVRLQTHLVVREDALTLYGFASQRERWLFVALLGVSGLGPSKALSLLSGYPTDTLQRAIAAGDLALLASVSGIGKRTAERIVVELRDKLGAVALESVASASGSAAAPAPDDPHLAARDALVALGFAVAEAETALAGTSGATEQRLKEALAALRRGGPA
jgi:holliday junction DNA helicase RuvA